MWHRHWSGHRRVSNKSRERGGTMDSSKKPNFNKLRKALHGVVVLPGDAGYDLALQLQDVQFDVILASGEVVRCSGRTEPDLVWALRGGGGGNFGVVTSYEIDAVSLPRVVNFAITWSMDSAASAISAWQQWAPTRPNILTSWMG